MSNRRERTANTPTRSESQVLRTTASQIMAAPNRKVARRQCSIRLITPEATTPRPNSAINTHCSQPGKGEGFKWISCGCDTGSIFLQIGRASCREGGERTRRDGRGEVQGK